MPYDHFWRRGIAEKRMSNPGRRPGGDTRGDGAMIRLPSPRRPREPKLPQRVPCPRCQGTGQICQRQPILQRFRCPKCGGKKTLVVLEAIWTEVGAKHQRHPTRRLSRLQKTILRNLLGLSGNMSLGASTKLLRQGEPKTGARNAAFARALSRLEKRGLVVRTNHLTGIPGQGIIRTSADQRCKGERGNR